MVDCKLMVIVPVQDETIQAMRECGFSVNECSECEQVLAELPMLLVQAELSATEWEVK